MPAYSTAVWPSSSSWRSRIHSAASSTMFCMATAVRMLSSLMDCMMVYPLTEERCAG